MCVFIYIETHYYNYHNKRSYKLQLNLYSIDLYKFIFIFGICRTPLSLFRIFLTKPAIRYNKKSPFTSLIISP